MNGIGGQQPINQPLITGDNKATNSNNVEASHGRFKISLPSGIRNFLSALLPSGIMGKSIQSYDVKPMPGMPQQAGAINKNAASQNSGNLPNTVEDALQNPKINDALEQVQDLLKQLDTIKGAYEVMDQADFPGRLKPRLERDIPRTRLELKAAVDKLNPMLADNLKLDVNEIEASLSKPSDWRGRTFHRSATNNSAAKPKPSPFDNALDTVANGNDKNAVKKSFQKVDNSLQKVLNCKANLVAKNEPKNHSGKEQAIRELAQAKREFKAAVQDFNGLESVDKNLVLDANDIENALIYKDDKILESAFKREAQQHKEVYNKFEKMKNTLL